MADQYLRSPIGEPPAGWRLTRLKDITIKIGSGATPRGGSAVYRAAGIAFVRSQNVYDRHFSENGLVRISDEDARSLDGVTLQSGDVLLNITGDGVTFGRACIVPDELGPARVNQHVAIVRADPRICHPGFLLSYLTHPLVKEYIESFNAGGSRRAITKGHIESFVVPLPPLGEQVAMADLLGGLDRKIDLNRRMNQTLEAMAQALFRSWFVDFDPVRAKAEGRQPDGMDAETAALFPSQFVASALGEIPEGWTVSSLGDVTSTLSRGIGPSYVEQGGILVLNQKCVRDGRVQFTKARRHDPAQRLVDGRLLQDGDVLVNSTGMGTLGRVATVEHLPEEQVIVDSHVTVVRANPRVLSPLLLGLGLLGREAEIEALGEGSTGQTELSRERLRRLPLVVPPAPLQDRFHTAAADFRLLVAKNERQSETLVSLRDLLLPKLLSGEIRVRDAEDRLAASA